MIWNDLYRKTRFRADDPLRYLHVPRRLRGDADEARSTTGTNGAEPGGDGGGSTDDAVTEREMDR
jgi:hypothetical protein